MALEQNSAALTARSRQDKDGRFVLLEDGVSFLQGARTWLITQLRSENNGSRRCDGANETTDRRTPVWSALLRRQLPLPGIFNYSCVSSRSGGATDAWVKTPWLHANAVVAGNMCDRCTSGIGCLPCEMSLRALELFSWPQHCCFKDVDLLLSRDGTLMGAYPALLMSSLGEFSRRRLLIRVPRDLCMDTCQYCTESEGQYAA